MSTAQNAVVDCCSCCSCCCCSCSLSFSALQLAIALMISFTRFPLHCCMSVCVALPLCVCVCSRRKMAALIRVDISGHTTAAPLEIATTPPYTHTHLHTHTRKKGAKGHCVDYATTAAGNVQVSTVRDPKSGRKWVGKGKDGMNGTMSVVFFFSPTAFSC